MKKLLPTIATLAAIVCAALLFGTSQSGDESSDTVPLFKGATISANAGALSPWIDVRGANRILLRTWSTLNPGTGASPTAAWSIAGDSVYVDSLVTFEVYFSDSVSFIARDSAGTIVPCNNATSADVVRDCYPICADSVIVRAVSDVTQDTTYKFVQVQHPPLMEPLKPNVTGSGVYTYVVPLINNAPAVWGDGSMSPKYMRVKVRPWKRRVITGSTDSTQGVKGLRMNAIRIYKNK